MIAPQLTTGEYAALVGQSIRKVQYQVARGEFPPGSVYRTGTSKHLRHARLLTAKLLEAGWLLPEQVRP